MHQTLGLTQAAQKTRYGTQTWNPAFGREGQENHKFKIILNQIANSIQSLDYYWQSLKEGKSTVNKYNPFISSLIYFNLILCFLSNPHISQLSLSTYYIWRAIILQMLFCTESQRTGLFLSILYLKNKSGICFHLLTRLLWPLPLLSILPSPI